MAEKPFAAPKFRANAKHFFLTFPRCNATLERLQQHMAAFLPASAVVAKEQHKDGGEHRHVYIEFSEKRNVRQSDFFDFDGFHCNIQTCRNPIDVLKYCTKEENYLTIGSIDVQVWLRCYSIVKCFWAGEVLTNVIERP